MSRLIYANLDGESELSGRGAPPGQVVEALARWATLLRVFAAADDDELRLPWPIAAPNLSAVPGLPRPRIGIGRLSTGDLCRPLLPWLVTPELDSCAAPRVILPVSEFRRLPLHQLLWRLPRPSAAVTRRVHHRAFALATAEELGCALPGARLLRSLTELGEAGKGGAWVVKAPLSAAGRERHVHRGGRLGDKAQRAVERLFQRHGELLFEPWMERLDDFGCVAAVGADEVRVAGLHRQLVDRQGRFRGVELTTAPLDCRGLRPAERDRLLEATEKVGRALLDAGYRGAFGVDAWRYRDASGAERFHPMGEINARPSFGLVARILVARSREAIDVDPAVPLRLVPLHLGPRRASAWPALFQLEAASMRIML